MRLSVYLFYHFRVKFVRAVKNNWGTLMGIDGMRWFAPIGLAALLVSCGGGGSSPTPAPPPPADQAIGGAWVGADSSGLTILALATESGRIHWIAPDTGEQGFGTGSVNGSAVTINYTYVAPLIFVAPIGSALADGSTSATCSATGTIQERQSMAVNTDCTTSLGGTFSTSASLTYDALYDRDSSLSVIAGNYDDFGLVVNINATGVIFEQDPGTGCVINGQVSIIDSEFNAYDVLVSYSNCIGIFAVLNGANFTGLAILDNTVMPEEVTVGMTGAIGGITYSVVLTMPRI